MNVLHKLKERLLQKQHWLALAFLFLVGYLLIGTLAFSQFMFAQVFAVHAFCIETLVILFICAAETNV